MNKFKPRLIGSIVLVVFISLSVVFTLTHAMYGDYAYYCYIFVAPLFVWFSLDVITSLFEKETIFGIFKTSGFIFFVHLFIVNGFKVLFELGIKTNSNYNCALLFFLVLIVSTIVTLGLTYLMQRFAKPVYKYLGGR